MMRTFYSLSHGLITTLLPALLLVACGKTDDATASAGDTDTGGSGTTDEDPTGNDPSTNDPSNTSSEGCTPGASVACTCTDGDDGAQVCADDGKSFEPCVCEGGSAEDSNSSASSTSQPTTGVDETTTGDGTTGDGTTGAGTTGDGTTGDGTTGGGACEDPGPEPNEEENAAVELEDQTCTGDNGTLSGVLAGDTDVDWFLYRGIDGQGCGFDNPSVTHTLTAGDAVRLCVFIECDDGDPEFDCPEMDQSQDSPDRRPGCCATGDLGFQFNCVGSPNETVDVFVRVDQAPADACVDYSVEYSFGPTN